MNSKHFIFLLAGFVFWASNAAAQHKSTQIDKSLTIITDVMRQLDINYADTLNYNDITEEGIRRMLAKIDPYTVYIPKQDDDNLRIMTTGKYGGIGALIMQRDSCVFISEPYEGMPAQTNDVRAGDKILKIDNTKCYGMTTREVSNMLRGEAGTTVRLTIERQGESKPIVKELTRREIHLPAIGYYTAINNPTEQSPNAKTGYILFSEFTAGSAMDVLQAIETMSQKDSIDRLILDLRGNGGGLIDEAVQLVGFFVDKGTEVVSTKGKTQNSNRSYTTAASPVYKDLPLVILVNGQSASASEIVSGSLQDLGRATIVGQRTFGKGLVQSIRPIAYDGHLKVTTAHYYLPSGRCIQAIDYGARQRGQKLEKDTAGGILPDVVITDTSKLDITYTLFRQHCFFDYANLYRQTHTSIAPPDSFAVTDSDLEDFILFLENSNFKYETETSRYFDELLTMAKDEDLAPATLSLMDSLQTMLKPSFKDAVYRHKEEIKRLIGAEIAERYYFQKGKIIYMLRDDKELQKAIEVIKNKQ